MVSGLRYARAANAANATLYERLNFNFIRDAVPVASISHENYGMEFNPAFPTKTVPEFISYAKANPGKLNMASPGNGRGPHLQHVPIGVNRDSQVAPQERV